MVTGVLDHCQQRGHEQVNFFHYPEVGLKAIVSIHSTVLGPALGGCRMRLYDNEAQALEDVMRLAEGMTYKSALAGMNLGGGKACIIADSNLQDGRTALLHKFGECLNSLNGRYITAEDMGTSVADMQKISEVSKFLTGCAKEAGGSGDPSPWTAQGVFQAILAACDFRFDSENLAGKTVALQGIGHVGYFLAEYLAEAGAQLIVCDPNPANCEKAQKQFNARVVSIAEIYDQVCDIYAPCAIGQTINPSTIGRLKCKIIAGAANNQLSSPDLYQPLITEDITYCPDFAINPGGVISVGAELNAGGWSESWVTAKIREIKSTTLSILKRSQQQGVFPEKVALQLAHERLNAAKAA